MANEQNKKIITDEALELQEYKLTDKVQNRIISRAKYFLGAFLAGLTMLGVIGSSYLIEHISQKVAKEIRKDLMNETEVLKNRLRETLADLNVSSTEIQKIAEKSKKQLKHLESDYRSLDDLKNSYNSLYSEISDIQKKLNKTALSAKQAQKNTESLRDAIIKSAEGKPAMIGRRLKWGGDPFTLREIIISGSNLGSSPGTVEISITHHRNGERTVNSKTIQIDSASFNTWSNNKIEIVFSEPTQKILESFINKLRKKLPEGNSWGLRLKAKTVSGEDIK